MKCIGRRIVHRHRKEIHMKRQAFLCIAVSAIVLTSLASLNAQLASTAWPMFKNNLQRTGLSSVEGSHSGTLVWSYTAVENIESSPILGINGEVHIGSADNVFYAMSSSGALGWSYTGAENFDSSAAVASDGRAFVGNDDNNVYAFISTGALSWSYASAGFINSCPSIDESGILYIGSGDSILYALTSSGSLQWSYETGSTVDSSPALSSIVFGSNDNNLYALNSSGGLEWSYATGDDIDEGAPAVSSDGTIYVGSYDNILYSIRSNGALNWSYETREDIDDASPAIGPNGRIVIGSDDNILYAIDSNGHLAWRFLTDGIVDTSPAIGSDGTNYFGSKDNTFYSLLSIGTISWSYIAAGDIDSSAAIGSDGRVYVGSDDNTVYVFEGPPPIPNYINLSVSPATVSPGTAVTLSYVCDFSTYDYEGVPVDIYLAAIKSPVTSDAPSSVADALAGGTVYLFGRNMTSVYVFTGSVGQPTFSGVAFPPVPISGTVAVTTPAASSFAGDYVFATAFIRRDTGGFVRTDGLPVENSNLFTIP